MNKNLSQLLMLLIGVYAYDMFFWQEKFGINCLLFSSIIISLVFLLDPKLRVSKPVILTAFGTILTAILIVLNNSLFSKIIYIISFIIFIGFSKSRALRFIWLAVAVPFLSFSKIPMKLFRYVFNINDKNHGIATIWRTVQISIVPFLILVLFYLIYYLGNSNFNQISDTFWSGVITWFQWDITFNRVIFFTSGVLIIGTIVYHFEFPYFKKLQNKLSEKLIRTRRNKPNTQIGTISLKYEYRKALMTIVGLNFLLFL